MGATWTKHPSSGAGTMVLSDANRARVGTTGGVILYYASGAPAGADYSVAAPVFVVSNTTRAIGVTGRMDTAANTYYAAWYDGANSRWELRGVVAGVVTTLGTFAQSLTVGNSYTVTLQMVGTAITLLVDGSPVVSVTDSSITAAGRAGVFGSTASSNTTGYHLDSISAVNTLSRTTSDSLSISDSPARQVAATRQVTDSTHISDSPAGGSTISTSASDSVTIADTPARTVSRSRQPADTLALSEQIARRVTTTRTANDGLSVTDSAGAATSTHRGASDLITLGDVGARVITRSRGATDSLTVADALVRLVRLTRVTEDPLGLVDVAAGVTATVGAGAGHGARGSIGRADAGSRGRGDSSSSGHAQPALTGHADRGSG